MKQMLKQQIKQSPQLKPKTQLLRSTILALALLIAGCAANPINKHSETYTDASRSLVLQANEFIQNEEFNKAESTLERALRIEPTNAYLWLKISELNCTQSNYAACRNFALKGQSLNKNTALDKQFLRLLSLTAPSH
ncbi:MAG: Tfp pilus assembly protein PilF [Flavobacteriales bacterium]|jgi:Tfp pilus assembly protein PilF